MSLVPRRSFASLVLTGSIATLASALGCGGGGGGGTPAVDSGVDSGATCDTVRFVAAADTVLDTQTSLTWQRAEATTKYTWVDANAYCAGLALDGGGWRLPSIDELLGIVVVGEPPTIDACSFPNTTPNWFWSGTEDPVNVLYARTVYFGVGNAGADAKHYEYRVRCVRP